MKTIICPKCKGKGYLYDTVSDIIVGIITIGLVHMGGRLSKEICDGCGGKGLVEVK